MHWHTSYPQPMHTQRDTNRLTPPTFLCIRRILMPHIRGAAPRPPRASPLPPPLPPPLHTREAASLPPSPLPPPSTPPPPTRRRTWRRHRPRLPTHGSGQPPSGHRDRRRQRASGGPPLAPLLLRCCCRRHRRLLALLPSTHRRASACSSAHKTGDMLWAGRGFESSGAPCNEPFNDLLRSV